MRELYTARLERKSLLSAAAECYHFEFAFTSEEAPGFEPGQFFSLVADDAHGKTYTRAYSIASAPRGLRFDMCVNRVEGGFFSNRLCDLREGDSIECHGPHGLFTLRQPAGDGLMIAAGTGIAPLRGFVQRLFPAAGLGSSADRSEGHTFWLIYEGAQTDELFYDSEFRELAAMYPDFHYLPLVGRDGDREGTTEAIARVAAGWMSTGGGGPVTEMGGHAYVCGLSEFVKAARTQLLSLGWPKRQILSERYD